MGDADLEVGATRGDQGTGVEGPTRQGRGTVPQLAGAGDRPEGTGRRSVDVDDRAEELLEDDAAAAQRPLGGGDRQPPLLKAAAHQEGAISVLFGSSVAVCRGSIALLYRCMPFWTGEVKWTGQR